MNHTHSPKILIDNGHGVDTPGKRSPDGRLLEWHYTREIARRVVDTLRARSLDAELLTPEIDDIPLRRRVERANSHPAASTILVSIHCNAASMGHSWCSAHGWSVFVAPGASDGTLRLASLLYDAAERRGLHMRAPAPGVKQWTAPLAICRSTRCPAVLTENLFMDSRSDVDFLLSPQGRNTIVDIHVDAITRYIQSL